MKISKETWKDILKIVGTISAGDAAAVKPLNQTCSKPVYRLAASWFFLEHKHSINIK